MLSSSDVREAQRALVSVQAGGEALFDSERRRDALGGEPEEPSDLVGLLD